MHITRRQFPILVLTPAAVLLAAACAESVATQVAPIAKPLPEREETRYRLLDSSGAQIGTALFTIVPDPDGIKLGLAYDFGADKKDTSNVVVHRDSMRPVHAERTVVEGDRTYITRARYNGQVAVTFDDSRRTRELKAGISETSYDNLESLQLWRTLDFSTGAELRYVNVVVDPRRGNISRALGTVEIAGRENLATNAGATPAWRVLFRSAGVTNTAWYRDDAGRALLRYEITRGPTLVLDTP